MSRRLAVLLSLLAILAAALPALAKRPTTPAKSAASVKATASDDAAEIAKVKKGDALTLLGSQGGWAQVMLSSGKKGWVHADVVGVGGTASVNTGSGTQVAAAEGDTAMAVRGKMRKMRTVVVGTGGLNLDTVKRIADLLKKESRLYVVDTRTMPETKPGSPAGGVDGAKQLGAAKQADLVVAVQAGAGGSLAYEAVDVEHGTVLTSGATLASSDSRKPIDEIAQVVIKALPPPPSPSATASPSLPAPTIPASPNPTASLPASSATGTSTPLPNPNAPATPAPTQK